MSLPLDSWRSLMGLSPWAFWGFADTGASALVPVREAKASWVLFEYDWQGSDAAGRDSIREAIVEAEAMLLRYLNYRPAPEYASATVDWPRHYQKPMLRGWDYDATARRIAVAAPEGRIQALGVEARTLIGQATTAGGTLVYSAQFGQPSLQDTFTITLPIPVGMSLSADEVAVYFTSTDLPDGGALSERWRVAPVKVTISGGNVVITGRKWLLAKPILYENVTPTPLNPTVAGNFVTALDVYRRWTNGDGTATDTCQATLIYESNDCGRCWGPCWFTAGPPASTDPAATGLVIARAGIRDSDLGLVTPGAASFDGTSWTSTWCCGYCEPDRVTLRYLAGVPLVGGQVSPFWQPIVAKLAAAQLKRRVYAGRETNEKLHDLQQDLTLESTQTERYGFTPEQLNNPFGTRRGHVEAWLASKDEVLRRGIAA